MVLSGDEGKVMESGFLPAGDTQSKSVGLSMRKKTHNLLYTAILYQASPVNPPELHLLPELLPPHTPPRTPVSALCGPAACQRKDSCRSCI